eukprot:TRINITY_DN11208_c0_g3_i1.p1 TRINITY_DN11208_c0_g3~~TRINITY_DN11208_c0_g3_i1.p1  ORF type:complete len:1483 (+),score=557.48 TRINITY_DN11208_c0_g3_i1:140-4588(+)
MSYAIFKQLSPPTTVEHCISASFTSEHAELILAKTSFLQVFRVHKSSTRGAGAAKTRASLELILERKLFGNIVSLNAVRLPGRSRDCLALSFSDAKVSIVEFDLATNDLKIVSLHSFENDALKGGRTHFAYPPVFRVDPKHRCGAMLVFDTVLAVVPFKRGGASSAGADGAAGALDDDDLQFLGETEAEAKGSYVIRLNQLGIKHVKDYVFLHGFYEPTILIMHEPKPTSVGRLRQLSDSVCLTALSLTNSQRGKPPVIWSVERLPWDLWQMVAVPEPIGGALVLGYNEVFYFNQNNKYGLTLNDFATHCYQPPFATEKCELQLTLDASRCAFLASDRVLVSLKGGELYLFTLELDGRNVTGLKISKTGSSVLTSCLCTVGSDLVFLGSRLGDSLLIHYTPKLASTGAAAVEEDLSMEDGRPEKRQRLAGPEEPTEPSAEGEDEDELLYGPASTSAQTQFSAYSFAVCDSVPNVGPIGDSCVGESFDLPSQSHVEQTPGMKNYEIVSCSGQGKNGCLVIAQDGIRPELVTAFDLPGCLGAWTLFDLPEEELPEDAPQHHSFLLLSREATSLVLATGEELQEVTDRVQFHTEGPTLEAGNVDQNRRIVQVYPGGIRLLKGAQLEQELPLEQPPLAASIRDPYVLVVMHDRSLRMFCFESDPSPCLVPSTPTLTEDNGFVSACSVFFDENDHFPLLSPGPRPAAAAATASATAAAPAVAPPAAMDVDSDEDELYGGGAKTAAPAPLAVVPPATEADAEATASDEDVGFRCILTRENGRLEVYSLPAFELVFATPLFHRGRGLLGHNVTQQPRQAPRENQPTMFKEDKAAPEPFVIEIGVHYLDDPSVTAAPSSYIFAFLSNGDLLLYRSFMVDPSAAPLPVPLRDSLSASAALLAQNGPTSASRLRFSKVDHEVIFRDMMPSVVFNREVAVKRREQLLVTPRRAQLKPFASIGQRRGLFISGSRPVFVLVERGAVRLHAMHFDGAAVAFAPFDNVNCPDGLIYCSEKGSVKICQLSNLMSYEGHWPVRKVPLRVTPHHIAYHSESQTYALSISSKVVRSIEDANGDEHDTGVGKSPTMNVYEERFELRLLSPANWELLDTAVFMMHEHILSMRVCQLKCSGLDAVKNCLVIGTANVQGEDSATRGRILVFEVVMPDEVNADEEQEADGETDADGTTQTAENPASESKDGSDVKDESKEPKEKITSPKLKLMYQQEEKGPVSAVSALEGYLMACIGPKIIIYNFTGMSLVGMAFYDAQLLVSSGSGVKNFVLCGDIAKSVFFLRWKEGTRQLSLLAKDFYPQRVFATEFLVLQTHLSLLSSDANRNVHLYSYAPLSIESRGGQMLLVKADFHLGAHVEKFMRLRMNPGRNLKAKRHAVVFGTLDGAFGCLAPVEESVFKRLFELQTKLTNFLPHVAGLNPRAFRAAKSDKRLVRNMHQGVLDGVLLQKFLHLELMEQRRMARQIGTTPEQIIDNLLEVSLSTTFF